MLISSYEVSKITKNSLRAKVKSSKHGFEENVARGRKWPIQRNANVKPSWASDNLTFSVLLHRFKPMSNLNRYFDAHTATQKKWAAPIQRYPFFYAVSKA